MTQSINITPQGILWDLDNTLYRLNEALDRSYNNAVAYAVIEWGLDIDYDAAFKIAEDGWREKRFSARYFIDHHKIPIRDLHFLVDKHLNHKLIEKCEETCRLFAGNPASHALITHAARRWGITVLDHLGLTPWFPDHAVFGYETYDFASKAESRKSFEMALTAINKNPSDCLMVEDTMENLRVAHDMGMTTVLVHHGKVPDSTPDFVHHQFQNARELLAAIAPI